MAEAARALEARLVAQLTDIFPEIDERIIRDNVYSALLATNFPAPDEYLLDRCVEALLTPAGQPETGAVGTKRVRVADSPEEIKRARRVGGDGDGGSSSADDSIQLSEEEAAGPQIDPVEFAKQAGMKSISDMFPWIDPAWVSQQFGKPNVNVATLADMILANQSAIPKKLKPKPQIASSVSTASTSGATTTTSTCGSSTAQAPQQPGVKDFLNDFANYSKFSNDATHYLSVKFPWIYMSSITTVLNRFKGHLAPAYQVLNRATKDIDFSKRQISIPATIILPSVPNQIVHLKVVQSRRTSRGRRSMCPELQEEINWIENHFHSVELVVLDQARPTDSISGAAADNAAQAQADADAAKMDREADLKLEQARERGDVFECEICFGEHIISEQMVTCANGHMFCAECLREYGREAIYGQGKSDLLCMNEQCDARFLQEMLVKALDAESLKKLEEKRMVASLNSADIEGLEKCLYCNYAASFDVPPEVNKVFQCGDPNCERQYCRICHVDWEEHIGKPCKEVETQDDTRKRREAEEQMAAAVIRKCNKCKAPLIKEEGCNKLVCSCGAIMCYLCRQSIEKEKYAHFCQHPRDPGSQSCSLCKKCSLWEDPKVKDSAAVKQIQTEATKALAESGKILKVGAADSAPRPLPAAAVGGGYPQNLDPVMAGMHRQVQQLAEAVAQVARGYPGYQAGNQVGVQFQQYLPAQVVNQNAQQYDPHGGARPRDPMPAMPMFRQVARRARPHHVQQIGAGNVVAPPMMPPMPMFARRGGRPHYVQQLGAGNMVAPPAMMPRAPQPQPQMDPRLPPDGGYHPGVNYNRGGQYPPNPPW